MANTYLKGQQIKVTGVFRDVDTGVYVDPAVVTFRTLNPNNVVAEYVFGVDPNVIQESTGHYRYDLALDVAGTEPWYYRWEGTGDHMGVGDARVNVCIPPWPLW